MPASLLTHLILLYRYPLVLVLTIVEGPFIMMLGGFFVRVGAFDLVPMYLILMAGDLVGDIFWYGVGYYWGWAFIDRFGRFFSVTKKDVTTLEKFFHKYHNSILILSKMTMGFGFALVTLITAGLTKIPFKRYLYLNFLGQFVWTGILMAIGFFLGNVYVSVNNIFVRVSIIVFFVILFVLLLGVGKFIKSSVQKKLEL